MKELFVYKLERGKEFVGVFVLNWNGNETELVLEPDEVDQVRLYSKNTLRDRLNKNNGQWSVMGYEDKLFELI